MHTHIHVRVPVYSLTHPPNTHPLFVVGDMAADHIAGLAFGGQQPHSPSEHVVDPNVLVIHSVKVSLPYTHWLLGSRKLRIDM